MRTLPTAEDSTFLEGQRGCAGWTSHGGVDQGRVTHGTGVLTRLVGFLPREFIGQRQKQNPG